jgi:putative membrane protein
VDERTAQAPASIERRWLASDQRAHLPRLLTTPPPTDSRDLRPSESSRRTWLAAERTWLAWVRTGLGASAVAIGVGGVLPHLSTHAEWPYRLLGLGYGVLAAAIFVVGSVRQRRGEKALRQGDLEPPLGPLVMWVTFAAIALTTVTLTLLAIGT